MSALSNWDQFKERYGTTIAEVLPEETSIAKLFPYVSESGRPGEAYNQSVQTQIEHGVTFNVDGSAFTLNAAIDSVIKSARLSGAEIAFKATIPYAVQAQSQGAGNGNEGRAFFEAVELKMRILAQSGDFYREIHSMYGCGTASAAAANIGVVSASISGANLAAPQVVSITRASWAASLWLMMKGGLVDIYQSDATTLRASGVTVQALPAAGGNRVQLFKSGSSATVAANDIIVMSGALAKQAYGVQPILENTGSLFGIDASTEAVWKSVSYSAGSAALTISKLRAVGTRLRRNGLSKGADAVVSPEAFGDLSDELEGDQRVTDDRPARRMGPNEIVVRTPCGDISVWNNTYMKQGFAFVIGKGDIARRIGAQELGFDVSGMRKFLETPSATTAGYELRMYGQNAPFIEAPAHCAIINGIQSTADTTPS